MNTKVFVVDDNKKNIRLLQEILEDNQFEVHSFEDGLSVVTMAKELKPDIILLDIMMPQLDGFEVCRQLKNDMGTRDIPVIMITAKAEGEDVKKALELGVFDYIKKPIDEVETLARINAALRYQEHQDQLQQLAMKDSLTGLYNHALLTDSLERELRKAIRTNGRVAYAMLDIDFFKAINDTYGHEAGNRVLKEIASILSRNIRRENIVGRYGGEEFGLILPDVSGEQAYQLCERIRKTVEDFLFDLGPLSVKVTVSIGVCISSSDMKDKQELIQMADQMLYAAKAKGRNRVEIC